jgi:hypothetical protein
MPREQQALGKGRNVVNRIEARKKKKLKSTAVLSRQYSIAAKTIFNWMQNCH